MSRRPITGYTPRIHSYPPDRPNKCLECRKPLIELYRTNPRVIRRLTEDQEIVEHILTCLNPSCPSFKQKLYPDRITPPKSSFHFEVVVEAGRLRRQENKNFKEISQILRDRGVRIGTSPSCSQHLFHYFEIYELIWAEQELIKRCRGQEVVIAIDGAKPKNGTQTLYLATNAWNTEMYTSEWLRYSGTQDLVQVLQKLKNLDLNVVGIVSDKQASILLAVREVFGEIPHQFCQFHWFLDACKLLYEFDRRFNKELKKKLRKLRVLKRYIKERVEKGKLPSHNLFSLEQLEDFLTVILKSQGKAPFVFAGLRNWNRLKMLLVETMNYLIEAEQDPFDGSTRQLPHQYKSLIQVLRFLATMLEERIFDVWAINIGVKFIQALENLLDPFTKEVLDGFEKKTSFSVKQDVETLLLQYKSINSVFVTQFVAGVENSLIRWNKGLYTCLDYPFVPRTNNNLEQYIHHLKRRQKKISGRHDNHSTLRRQQCFRHVRHFPLVAEFVFCCTQVSLYRYHKAREEYLVAIEPLRREYRIKRNFQGMLHQTFDKIKEEIDLSLACN